MKHIIFEAVGWAGAVAVLAAYALVGMQLVSPTGIVAFALNFFGAAGLVAVSAHKKAWPPAILNGIWLLIALMNIVRMR